MSLYLPEPEPAGGELAADGKDDVYGSLESVCARVCVRVIRVNRADVGNCVTGAINGTRASFRIFMVRLRPSLGVLLTRGAPVRPTAVLQGPGKGRETSLLSWD